MTRKTNTAALFDSARFLEFHFKDYFPSISHFLHVDADIKKRLSYGSVTEITQNGNKDTFQNGIHLPLLVRIICSVVLMNCSLMGRCLIRHWYGMDDLRS